MKGLLIKDLLNLKKQGKTVLAILAFYIVFALTTKNASFLTAMFTLLLSMMSISSFSYDEMAKWNKFAASLPLTRRDIVGSKYLLAFLLSFAGLATSMLLSMGSSFVVEGTSLTELLLTSYCSFLIAMLMQIVMLPLLFQYGAEKSRTMLMGVVAVPMVLVFILSKLGMQMPGEDVFFLLLKLAVPILIVLFAISYRISCAIYQRKEL